MNLKPPKDLTRNVNWRDRLLRAAQTDEELQHELWIMSKRDIVFWLDAFGWTFANKDYPDNPHRPFLCWEYQEQTLSDINEAIGKHDLVLEKSRDMGASWMVLATFAWRMVFFRGQSLKVCSRKEDYVDKTGDPQSLFWKIDYLLDHLPFWMQPAGWRGKRVKLHIEAPANASVIDGESTNDDMARGDRRQAILLDEFAAVDKGYPVLSATRDATNCRIFVSTPQGAVGAYYDQLMKMKSENPERVKRLHWTLHPLKSKGVYLDPQGKQRSPWYDEQCRRAATEWEVAQELDIKYVASGTQAIDQTVVDRLLPRCRLPVYRGEISYGAGVIPEWTATHNGRIGLWTQLIQGSPPSDTEYVIGCDIAMGTGGEQASQSVASIADRRTGLKVGRFAVRDMDPTEFAEYCVSLAEWFRGRGGEGAFLIWEANGPGGPFGDRVVKHLKYPNIYLRSDPNKITKIVTNTPGWFSSTTSKRLLLTDYFRALKDGTFTNYDSEGIKETMQYVVSGGSIEHSRAKATSDPMAQGDNHGDIVIADALACRGIREFPAQDDLPVALAPEGSFAWRQAERRREVKKRSYY